MINFNTKAFIDCAEELLRADETERALWLLDNLPAWYRDNTPQEILDLKTEVVKRIATPTLYTHGDIEGGIDVKDGHGMGGSLRGLLIQKEVKWFNDHGLRPHVIDYGPGEYWLPVVLYNAKLNFTYQAIHLNNQTHATALDLLKEIETTNGPRKDGDPKIFVACEIIEHLWNEQDIKTEMLSHCGFADVIHISTPCYTFDIHCTDWKVKDRLGHLRAYTPREFNHKLESIFREYKQFFFYHQIMHARLTNANSLVPGLIDKWNKEFESL